MLVAAASLTTFCTLSFAPLSLDAALPVGFCDELLLRCSFSFSALWAQTLAVVAGVAGFPEVFVGAGELLFDERCACELRGRCHALR